MTEEKKMFILLAPNKLLLLLTVSSLLLFNGPNDLSESVMETISCQSLETHFPIGVSVPNLYRRK